MNRLLRWVVPERIAPTLEDELRIALDASRARLWAWDELERRAHENLREARALRRWVEEWLP